jgi:glucose/arabinose dehydrogenase
VNRSRAALAAPLAGLLFIAAPGPATGACKSLAPGAPIPGIQLVKVVGGLHRPVHLTHMDDDRLVVTEQAGRVRIIEHGKLLPKPFLDIRNRVSSGGERGLLSIAFPPDYRRSGVFYVDYTSRRGGLHTVISRFRRASSDDADPGSEEILLTVPQPYSNHNGGQLAFGPDGYLYIGLGDGGSANDPRGNGQNPDSLLGAILRIDVSRAQPPLAYAIPKDNPFVNRPGHRPEIWAWGLRNPWRFSFDRATGRLFAADVGQDEVEEIDIIRKGGNYGWNVMEGNQCTPAVNERCDPSPYNPPLFTYRHPLGYSITGGFVYRGSAIPGLCGVCLYADYVTGNIWGLRSDRDKVSRQMRLIRNRGLHISSFGEDIRGELYAVDHSTGIVYRVSASDRR